MNIYDMKTEDRFSPIGIDNEKPTFCWKETFNQYAYKIIVKNDFETVWDSGKINSDNSIYIEYNGSPLEPMTRYNWFVVAWDENGNEYCSDMDYFETGLMGKDFSAKWIGSPNETINTSSIDTYTISATFISDKLGLAVNLRNKDNYILFEIKDKTVTVFEISDNAWGNSQPYKKILGEFSFTQTKDNHNFILSVNKRNVTLTIDDHTVINNILLIPENPINAPRKTNLMSIGFNQSENKATIKNLKVKSETLTLYEEKSITIENSFETICPVGSVNLRKCFTLLKKVKSARLYATARGFYEAYINGEKVGDDFYNPSFTDYRLRIQYQTFDVTDMLTDGKNVIGSTVTKGHYSGFCGYSGSMIYGKENSFICQLVLTYSDDSSDVIETDNTWEFTDKGAVVDSDYLDGETYDARLELNWSGNDIRWKRCGVKAPPKKPTPTNGTLKDTNFKLTAQYGNTAKVVNVLSGKFTNEIPKNHYIYDFGQNMVGTIRLTLNGKRGQSIKIRYGEMIYKNGEIYIQNLRSAANTDIYTLMGGGNETFVPSFTSHGFRYIEITGNGCNINKDIVVSVDGLVISNIYGITGDFECSNPLINKLQSNIQWGLRGNSLLVLTDCPQRNERMGWTGDVQVFAATGAYNMDMKNFTDKWLYDLIDSQLMFNNNGAVPDTAPLGGDNRSDGCAGWGDAAVIVPWEMYKAYGDIRVLENCYDMMKKWVDYQSRNERQNYGVRTVDGVEVPKQSDLASIPYIQVQQRRGDHLSYDCSTPYIYSATAYAAHVADILSQTAKILSKEDDAKKYKERFKKIKQAFNEAWVKQDGSIGYWGEMSDTIPHIGEAVSIDKSVTRYTYYSDLENSQHHPSQTAYALAIAFGLIPEDKLPHTAKCFKNTVERNGGKLTVGFLGISHLAPALSLVGLNETAFSLLNQEENPSWLYSVKNGATTIWERWNSYISETGEFGDVSMNSFNHYSYGAIGEWIFGTILGIKPLKAGYKQFALTPTIGGNLTYAKGYHNSPYGRIEMSWKKEDNYVAYEITVPPNTTAILHLPTQIKNMVLGITIKKQSVYELKSGKYYIEA